MNFYENLPQSAFELTKILDKHNCLTKYEHYDLMEEYVTYCYGILQNNKETGVKIPFTEPSEFYFYLLKQDAEKMINEYIPNNLTKLYEMAVFENDYLFTQQVIFKYLNESNEDEAILDKYIKEIILNNPNEIDGYNEVLRLNLMPEDKLQRIMSDLAFEGFEKINKDLIKNSIKDVFKLHYNGENSLVKINNKMLDEDNFIIEIFTKILNKKEIRDYFKDFIDQKIVEEKNKQELLKEIDQENYIVINNKFKI